MKISIDPSEEIVKNESKPNGTKFKLKLLELKEFGCCCCCCFPLGLKEINRLFSHQIVNILLFSLFLK